MGAIRPQNENKRQRLISVKSCRTMGARGFRSRLASPTTAVELVAVALALFESFPAAQAARIHLKVSEHRQGKGQQLRVRAAPEVLALAADTASEATTEETLDWSNRGLTSWSDIETNVTTSMETLNVSTNDLGTIKFTATHEELQTLNCGNASLAHLDGSMTYLVTLIAPANEFSSFDDIVLPSTIVSLDLSTNNLSDWENFEPPRDLQTLNVSHNSIADVSGSNLSSATDLVSIDLSFNKLTSVVGVIFPSNLTSLDLSNNNITEFEIRETDLTILANLANFTMDDLAQSDCPTSGATTETIINVQICVVSDVVFRTAYFRSKSAWQANIGVVYLSVAVSSLISIWFLALLVGHLTKKGKHAQTDTHLEKLELSGVTASRHWSLAKEEELPNDVRFDPELASLRIDPSDVMQVRSLAHGGFAMTSLVYFGDKQAVMKKVTMHTRGQDRNQMLAFMDEIRVCAKLDHPHVVALLGIMWTNIAELSALVEYVPRGNLALFLKEKKPTRKSARSMFTWMGESGDTPNKLSLALQIAEALVYLQSFSPPVIHGHLKAEVVLLGSDWAAKLNGLGYQLDIATRSIEDRAWVAPEVLTSGEFDEKSDIYSFGVVMSELDRCKRPFSRKESRRQSVEGAMPLKPTFRDDCPAEIQQIAQRCLQDEAADRPTAMELHYSLRQLRRQAQGGPRTSTDV